MTIMLLTFACLAFWAWMFGLIGCQALLLVLGIIFCLILLAEPSKR